MCHTSQSSFILGTFYDGKIEETGKQPKRSEPIQVNDVNADKRTSLV
jgi:hypothetical protein